MLANLPGQLYIRVTESGKKDGSIEKPPDNVNKPVLIQAYKNKSAMVEIASEDLFGNSPKINIRHQDELYTLQITRNNKLILTK